MAEILHQASIVVFQRYLARLAALLDLAQAHAGPDPGRINALLAARLAPDMLPLHVQVEVVSNFALRASFPLAGETVPDYGEFPAGFDGLRARIARTRRLLETLAPARFEGASARVIHDRAGDAELSLPATEFLFEYALPNFFFHLTTVYAILRNCGVAVGKADFDGYHRYPHRHPQA
ncbi:MAG: DUF1993 domain-containing protein [Lysobacteraceae bacterium]